MADLGLPMRRSRPGWAALRNRLVASPRFQAWAARWPLVRRISGHEGTALFGLVSGFVQSQCLAALVEFEIFELLMEDRLDADAVARRRGLPRDRARVLLQAGAALKLLDRRGDGYMTARRGAALMGVPGLTAMISHHAVLYRDLSDPVAFFRGETETELAHFWPYVLGAEGADDAQAARYSALMSDSQGLVADETLHAVRLRGVRHLMDVGGGSGAFLRAVAARYPALDLTLFDLPQVAPVARKALAAHGLDGRIALESGSFRDESLPRGADAISLVRVLYDHGDDTVGALLVRVHDALPPGGRVIVSEPMSGGARPESAGDVYFATYTLAMRTGRARSADEIAAALRAAGFGAVRHRPTTRPFVTSVVEAWKPVSQD